MDLPSARPALLAALAALAAVSTLAALPARADRPGPPRGYHVQPYRGPLVHAPGPAVRFRGPGAGPGYWYHGHHDGMWGWWWVAGTSWLFYPQPVVVQPAPPNP